MFRKEGLRTVTESEESEGLEEEAGGSEDGSVEVTEEAEGSEEASVEVTEEAEGSKEAS